MLASRAPTPPLAPASGVRIPAGRNQSQRLGRGPRLSLGPRGRLLAATALTWVTAGLALSLPVLTALGSLPAAFLAFAFVRTRVAVARLHEGAVVATLTPPGPSRTVVGRAVVVRADVRVAPDVAVHTLALVPGLTPPLEAEVVHHAGSTFEVHLSSARVGHLALLGFELTATVVGGLFEVRAWVPAQRSIEVLPRHFPMSTDAGLPATRAALQEHSDLAHRRRPGLGLEIRELRDFQAGDPFKHIAWSASARRGKLISREFESDLALSTWVVLDASPSMFWGAPGAARIDYAVETAFNLAAVLLERRDKVGLLVHDDRVRLVAPPAAGRAHLSRIVSLLTEVPHLVHEDRTEISDRELIDAVSHWFAAQRRRSFALPDGLVQAASPRLSQVDEARLIEAAQEVLQELAADARRRPLVAYDSYATDYPRSLLRAFCRHAGVPLPLDPTPRPGGQARGLEAAVEAVMATPGGPHTLVVLSDLYTADDASALRRVALAARRRRHALIVICPDHAAFDLPPSSPTDRLQRAIVDVERLRIRDHLSLAQTVLKPAGAVFLSVGPEDALSRVLARLRQAG